MSSLPRQLYWVIEHAEEASIDRHYWRKVRKLAQLFSIPVCIFTPSDAPRLFEGLRLSKKKIAELHELHNRKIKGKLEALKELFSQEYHLELNYKVICERPFFKTVIEEPSKHNENAWVVLQNSKKAGITNTIWQFIRHCPVPIYIAKEKKWQQPLNILAAIDPTHENDLASTLDHKILQNAIELANTYKANLHIIHCYPQVIMADQKIQKQIEQIYQDNFYETIENYKIPNSKAHCIAGNPVNEIEHLCEKLEIDLLIMGAISRNSLQRIFIGNTAEEVLPIVESDVLLVKARG